MLLDGKLLGYVDPKLSRNLVQSLRSLKILQHKTEELYQCVP